MGRGLQRAAALARFPIGSVAVATREMGQAHAPTMPVLVGERLRISGWLRLQDGLNFYEAWRMNDPHPWRMAVVVDKWMRYEPKEPDHG